MRFYSSGTSCPNVYETRYLDFLPSYLRLRKATVRLHDYLTINGKTYRKGQSVPWFKIYPFFLVHIPIFGLPVFGGAYLPTTFVLESVIFYHLLGSFAVFIYVIFYEAMFGRDAVKWMFIDGLLGIVGIYSVVGALLNLIDRDIHNYPLYRHVLPFVFYVLYVFLLRQAFLDITKSREDNARRQIAEFFYVGISLITYTTLLAL